MKEEIQSLKEYLVEKKEAHENGCVDSITLELWYESVQEIVNYITNLEKRIDKAIEDNEYLNKCNIELTRRNTKAIEYIENNTLYSEDYDYDDEDNLRFLGAYDYKAREDLLNILKGK